MYETTLHRDYVKTESEYRLGRIRTDIVGRRKRRALTRRGEPGDTTFTTVR